MDAGSIPAASTTISVSPHARDRALYCGRGPAGRHPLRRARRLHAAGLAMAARPGSAPREHRARARVHRGRPGRAAHARRGLGRLSRRRPAAHHPDRGERAVAGAAVVVAARRPLRLAGPAVRAVDHRIRVHAGGPVGRRRRLLRDRRLRPLAPRRGGRVPRDPRADRRLRDDPRSDVAESPQHLGLAVGRLGGRGGDPRSTAAASSAPSAGPRSLRPTARRAPGRPWRRSARASPASCTTASGTRSTWSCCTRAPRSASSTTKPELAARGARQHRDGGPAGAGRHRAHARHPARARRRRRASTPRRASASWRDCASRSARPGCPSP